MSGTSSSLPDLHQLDSDALRTLILSQHEQILLKDEQLASRDAEIEQLKLLIAKLQRMQFGRKSEKVERQIEQLQLRLDELEASRAERASSPATPETHRATKPVRLPLPEHLPRETVTAPPGAQIQDTVNIIPPPLTTSPLNAVLVEGNIGVPGINLFASAGHLPAGGQYQWVQLIEADSLKFDCPVGSNPVGPQTELLVSSSSPPVLHNTYPYSVVTTTFITNDGANDSPSIPLAPSIGEIARSFSANMYLMWIPPVLSGCTNGNACTVPVPLGTFHSTWFGDVVNTLRESSNQGVVFPMWTKNSIDDSNDGFLAGKSFPTWTAASVNRPVGCK